MSRTDLTSVRAAERVPRIPWYPGRELGQPQAGPQGGIQGRIPQIRVIAKTPDYGAARLHPGYKIKEFSTREICNLFPGHRTRSPRQKPRSAGLLFFAQLTGTGCRATAGPSEYWMAGPGQVRPVSGPRPRTRCCSRRCRRLLRRCRHNPRCPREHRWCRPRRRCLPGS